MFHALKARISRVATTRALSTQTNQVYVTGLPAEWGAAEIASRFSGDQLSKVQFLKNDSSSSTKNAIFTYSSGQDASEAIAIHH